METTIAPRRRGYDRLVSGSENPGLAHRLGLARHASRFQQPSLERLGYIREAATPLPESQSGRLTS